MLEQKDKKISYAVLISIVGNPELIFYYGILIFAIQPNQYQGVGVG